MPRPSNGAERRASLIQVAARLIETHGMDGLTVRDVARRADVSTGVVSHHFADKRELLQCTYDATADAEYRRIQAQASTPATDLQAILEEFLPLDSQRRRGWRIWLAFWGLAIGDRAFAADQRGRAAAARELVARILQAGIESGTLSAGLDVDLKARAILGLIQGIAVQASFDPADWPAERQKRVLADAVDALRRGRGDAAGRAGAVP